MRRILPVLLVFLLPVVAYAQPVTRLASAQTSGNMTTSGDVIDFPIPVGIGYGTIGVEARGTWTGTVAVQCLASQGGGTYVAIILSPRATSTSVTSFTANGQWSGSIAGCQKVRATATAAMTGTVTITMVGSFAGGGAGGGGGSGGAVTQGTDPWIVAGNLTNNGAAPSTNNVGALVAVGNAAAPTITEGRLAALSMDLSGALRVSGGGGGTQYTNDAALTPASTVGTIALGRSSAAAPTSVSADDDAVLPWYLRNGAQASVLTAAGALIGGDATNGLDVDVTRLSSLVAGNANIGDVDVATIAAGNNNIGDVDIASGTITTITNPVTVTDGAGSLNTIVDSGTLTAVTSITNTVNVLGTIANDANAAATNRVPVLPGITENSAPTRTDGRNAALSLTTGGATRVMITNSAGAATTIATDATHDSAASSTGPQIMGVAAADGSLPSAVTAAAAVRFATDLQGIQYVRMLDPCSALPNITLPISVAADTAVITATASKRTIICSGALVASAAEVVNIWEGTGSACGTSSAALVGSTTEANGMSFAANGGFTFSSPIRGLSTNVDVCIRLSATNRVAGYLVYVQAP